MQIGDIVEISSLDKKHISYIKCIDIYASDLSIPAGSKLAGYGFGGNCPACGSQELNVLIEKKAAEFNNDKIFYPGVYCRTCGLVYEYASEPLLCPVCRSILTVGKYSGHIRPLDFYPVHTLLCGHCGQEWEAETIIGIYNSGDLANWYKPDIFAAEDAEKIARDAY
jgi:uncharacterized protein YbaR (Trm112 family)